MSQMTHSNGTMFGQMCNPEAVTGSVYGHHPHHQSQHFSNSPDLGSPAYCGSGSGNGASDGASTNNGGSGHYGSSLHAAQAAAAAAAVAASAASVSEANTRVNNNRPGSNSVEDGSASGGQHSPTGIISDNGLQYANLDGSGGPGGPGGGGSYYGHHPAMASAGYHYSDIHGDGGLGAAIAASGGQTGGFSAYLDNPSAAAAAYAQSQYPSIYGQHHPHSLKSITRGSPHEFSPSSYPADFAAAAAVSKPAPAVPTYKWMQVKRNVPKPGRSIFFFPFLTGKASKAS